MNWKEHVKKAKHHQEIGNTSLYLDIGDGDYPWEFCTHCEPGGTHRLDMDTCVWFHGKHPCGLEFRWSFDLEPYSANGKGYYEIDTDGIRHVLSMLTGSALQSFRNYLKDCAVKVAAKAAEWRALVDRQEGDVRTLKQLLASN